MAITSGASSFNLQLDELVEEAFERAGGELRTGYDLRTARRSLNIMFADWANRGINMWTIEQGEITLVQGQNTYALPDDTVDLIEHVIRTQANVASTQADLTIPATGFIKIDDEIINYGYITQNTNATSGTLYNCFRGQQDTIAAAHTAAATVYWAQVPAITVWPTPDSAQQYTFVYWRLRRTQDAGGGVNVMDIPFRFIPCLAAGLAYYLALKVAGGAERLPVLKQQYDDAWELAATEDREKAAVRFVPRQQYIGGT